MNRSVTLEGILYMFMILSWCSQQIITAANKECYVDNLPQGTIRINNVHIINLEPQTSGDFFLSCRCTLYQPLWQVYQLRSREISDNFNGNVSCMNISRTPQDCDDTDTVYLPERDPHIELKTDNMFHINESTILMCYASEFREVVVFNMNDGDNTEIEDFLSSGDSLNIINTTTTTSNCSSAPVDTTSSSNIVTTSIATSHIIETTVIPKSLHFTTNTQQNTPSPMATVTSSLHDYATDTAATTTSVPPLSTNIAGSVNEERIDLSERLLSERELYLSASILVILITNVFIITILVLLMVCMKVKHANALKQCSRKDAVGDNSVFAASTENLLENNTRGLLSLATEKKPANEVRRSFSASALMFVNQMAIKDNSL